jgi:hypothetical protein
MAVVERDEHGATGQPAAHSSDSLDGLLLGERVHVTSDQVRVLLEPFRILDGVIREYCELARRSPAKRILSWAPSEEGIQRASCPIFHAGCAASVFGSQRGSATPSHSSRPAKSSQIGAVIPRGIGTSEPSSRA